MTKESNIKMMLIITKKSADAEMLVILQCWLMECTLGFDARKCNIDHANQPAFGWFSYDIISQLHLAT